MNSPITNTIVLAAPDCPAVTGLIPPLRGGEPTIASLQHEILISKPYKLTLEDLMLAVHLRREGLSASEAKLLEKEIHEKLFGKPYPCMRASPLPKKFGWGVHHNAKGKMSIFAVDSDEYRQFSEGRHPNVTLVYAMRSKRA